MSSRLTRFTGIAAGTVVSGALFLGGAAPAFADEVNVEVTQSNRVELQRHLNHQSNSSNVSASIKQKCNDNCIKVDVKQTNVTIKHKGNGNSIEVTSNKRTRPKSDQHKN